MEYPVVPLPGSDAWTRGYEWGLQLEGQFPGSDASSLASGCQYNGFGPAERLCITNLKMTQEGEPDGPSWIWIVTFEDGSIWQAEGWCDFTGWDCQSNLTWLKLEEGDVLIQNLLSLVERAHGEE